MSHHRPRIISHRAAAFTTQSHDEVALEYPHEGNLDDTHNGERTLVFYDAERYAAKQAEHGEIVYPKPQSFNSH